MQFSPRFKWTQRSPRMPFTLERFGRVVLKQTITVREVISMWPFGNVQIGRSTYTFQEAWGVAFLVANHIFVSRTHTVEKGLVSSSRARNVFYDDSIVEKLGGEKQVLGL